MGAALAMNKPQLNAVGGPPAVSVAYRQTECRPGPEPRLAR